MVTDCARQAEIQALLSSLNQETAKKNAIRDLELALKKATQVLYNKQKKIY